MHEAHWRLELERAGRRFEATVLGIEELGDLSASGTDLEPDRLSARRGPDAPGEDGGSRDRRLFPNLVFISDGETSLVVQVAGPHDAEAGEATDVVGLLPAHPAQRSLADALVRRRGTSAPVAPLHVDTDELRGRQHAATLVRVTAALRRHYRELGREHLIMEDGKISSGMRSSTRQPAATSRWRPVLSTGPTSRGCTVA